MEPSELDLPTLALLAGTGAATLLLERITQAGYSGVRPSHGYVIQRLVENEPTISALAASLGMTQQGASKQVKDLEEGGYVERLSAEGGDQRTRHVRLTQRGRGLLETGRRARAELEAEVAERIGDEALRAAKHALAALLEIAGLDDRVRTRTVPAPTE
jgi:DNA-binding MarR family transcriptional regulator